MANRVNEFMKEMTEITGLYGEALFAYIREKVSPPTTTTTKPISTAFYANETKTFEGSRDEFYDYLRLISGNMNDRFGGVSPFGLCVYAAKLNKVKHFVWKRPAQRRTTDGKCHYTIVTEEVFLDDRGEPIV